MSLFRQPRLSSVIVFALLCTYSSIASPVASADRPRVSIIDASEPVNIIPTEDLSPEQSFPSDGSTTYDDGTTITTTYNDRRKLGQRGNPASNDSVSEPVNIIPTDDLPPSQDFTSGSSTTNDDTTVTTTYTTSGNRNLLQTKSNMTGSLNLLNTKNRTLLGSEPVNIGINCQGSVLMCVGASQRGVMHTLRDYMYAIPKGYRYYTGQDIACMKHTVYPNPFITWGFYCAFMEGNIPADGVDGALIQLKMQQMIEHHCLGCGSVPFSDDNDPQILGVLTVNYVSKSECEGLCYYVPPGSGVEPDKVPTGMTLAS
ncbi:hypothetical protein IMSHALPRED_007832 [Imshaugia aleurites]|uniref:Killer toxin Kp4 domain-containing protein n=1 Tax=Imshaugia aleurites TaxID=172621 RepID=A0A8H3IIE7_9LECA|nr:hypothetical protein IMSHALPRED_007832 [Imshaugia aleurites]